MGGPGGVEGVAAQEKERSAGDAEGVVEPVSGGCDQADETSREGAAFYSDRPE